MQNQVRQLREKAGLSQRDLAGAVGTSQQQIARLESGVQSVKLDLALQLAAALKADLGQVFPAARKLIGRGKSKKTRDELVELHYDSRAVEDFDSAGVDLDPATWVVKLRLRGGASLAFTISTADAERMRRNLESRDAGTSFFIFNSSNVAVALNIDHLLHCHELWDGHLSEDWHDPDVAQDEVSAYLADSPTPLLFTAQPDDADPEDEDDMGPLRSVLFTLETYLEPGEFVSFTDSDGETAFFRASDLALLTIPLRDLNSNLNSALVDAEVANEAEDAATQDVTAALESARTEQGSGEPGRN